jgi:phosphoserine phosphatase RsbU/P
MLAQWKDEDYKRTAGLAALASWLVLTLLVLAQPVVEFYHAEFVVPYFFKALFFNLFIFSAYFYISIRGTDKADINFYSLIWSVFIAGVAGTAGSYLIDWLIHRLERLPGFPAQLFVHFAYKIEVAIVILFLLNAYVKWKSLLLYQPSRLVERAWRVFEYALFASLVLHFVPNNYYLDREVADFVFQLGVVFFFLFSLFLSFNLRWVAFLNLRQKLVSLLLMAVLLGCIFYFYQLLSVYTAVRPLVVDMSHSVFLVSLLAFVGIYSVFSVLIVFFNLPTTSVFEQKFSEVSDIQRLLEGRNEEQLHNIMLDIAIKTFKTDAAWLEVYSPSDVIVRNISKAQALFLGQSVRQLGYQYEGNRKFRRRNLPVGLHGLGQVDSVLYVPLVNNGKHLATLVLLSRRRNYFDNVLVSLVNMYANQASVALGNFRLVSEAVENERYQAELQTARQVQAKLLPKELVRDSGAFEVLARTHSPEVIGGDFYDYHHIAAHKHALIIGDVAGKGTAAAFGMSQMKGIFHSLVQLDLGPDVFLDYANAALGRSLAANSFVTATYLVVDTKHQKIYYARGGHCPILYWSKATGQAEYLQGRGMGLGIVRNQSYRQYLEIRSFAYQPGDLMLLYTDGLVEAPSRHGSGEEFGYDRLQQLVAQHAGQDLASLADQLVGALHEFAGQNAQNDDFTFLLLRFK